MVTTVGYRSRFGRSGCDRGRGIFNIVIISSSASGGGYDMI
jgi:hypothetical protein